MQQVASTTGGTVHTLCAQVTQIHSAITQIILIRTGVAVDHEQHGDDEEGAERVGEQVEGLGHRAHGQRGLGIEELEGGDRSQDLRRAHQRELERLCTRERQNVDKMRRL